MLIGFVVYLSLTPHPIQVSVEHGDKYGHVLAYGTILFWFAQLDARQRTRLAYAIGLVARGVVLEFAQRLSDYRVSEVADTVANAMGVLLCCVSAPRCGLDAPAVQEPRQPV